MYSSGNWSLTGNASTTAGTNFVGTTDAVDFVIKTNGSEAMRVASGGNVGIGEVIVAAALTDPGTPGKVLVEAASQDPEVIGEVIVAAAQTDPVTTGAVVVKAGLADPETTGEVLVEAASQDPEVIGEVIVAAALADPVTTGGIIVAAGLVNPTATGEVLVKAASQDPKVIREVAVEAALVDLEAVGNLLIEAASQDIEITGAIVAEAALIDRETTGGVFIEIASSDVEVAGAILAQAAEQDSEATGGAVAAAAIIDDSAAGNALAAAAEVNENSTGEALAAAAALAPPGVGDALAAAALADPLAAGLALAAAAASDPESTSEALAGAAASEPEASGQAMAYSAEKDPEATGDALAVAVRFDAQAIGQAFISALKLRAEAIANAIKFAAKNNAGGIQTALRTGPAQDEEASAILARVLPSISWVPQLAPEPGPDPAGNGVVFEAILVMGEGSGSLESSPIDRVLVKFPADREEPVVRIEVLPNLHVEVPDLSGDRIVSDFLSITGENFTSEDLVVAQVTLAVERSWLEANDVHEWSIEFARFDEESDTWKPALANRVGDDGDRILYSLTVTEFSLWSITGSTEPPPVIFRVDGLEILPGSMSQGELATVAATVSNILAEPAEYVAVLWVNGAMNASQTLAFEPNESRKVSFEISPDEGVYQVRIDRLSGTLAVVSGEGTSYFLWVVSGVAVAVVLSSFFFFPFAWRRRTKRERRGAFD